MCVCVTAEAASAQEPVRSQGWPAPDGAPAASAGGHLRQAAAVLHNSAEVNAPRAGVPRSQAEADAAGAGVLHSPAPAAAAGAAAPRSPGEAGAGAASAAVEEPATRPPGLREAAEGAITGGQSRVQGATGVQRSSVEAHGARAGARRSPGEAEGDGVGALRSSAGADATGGSAAAEAPGAQRFGQLEAEGGMSGQPQPQTALREPRTQAAAEGASSASRLRQGAPAAAAPPVHVARVERELQEMLALYKTLQPVARAAPERAIGAVQGASHASGAMQAAPTAATLAGAATAEPEPPRKLPALHQPAGLGPAEQVAAARQGLAVQSQQGAAPAAGASEPHWWLDQMLPAPPQLKPPPGEIKPVQEAAVAGPRVAAGSGEVAAGSKEGAAATAPAPAASPPRVHRWLRDPATQPVPVDAKPVEQGAAPKPGEQAAAAQPCAVAASEGAAGTGTSAAAAAAPAVSTSNVHRWLREPPADPVPTQLEPAAQANAAAGPRTKAGNMESAAAAAAPAASTSNVHRWLREPPADPVPTQLEPAAQANAAAGPRTKAGNTESAAAAAEQAASAPKAHRWLREPPADPVPTQLEPAAQANAAAGPRTEAGNMESAAAAAEPAASAPKAHRWLREPPADPVPTQLEPAAQANAAAGPRTKAGNTESAAAAAEPAASAPKAHRWLREPPADPVPTQLEPAAQANAAAGPRTEAGNMESAAAAAEPAASAPKAHRWLREPPADPVPTQLEPAAQANAAAGPRTEAGNMESAAAAAHPAAGAPKAHRWLREPPADPVPAAAKPVAHAAAARARTTARSAEVESAALAASPKPAASAPKAHRWLREPLADPKPAEAKPEAQAAAAPRARVTARSAESASAAAAPEGLSKPVARTPKAHRWLREPPADPVPADPVPLKQPGAVAPRKRWLARPAEGTAAAATPSPSASKAHRWLREPPPDPVPAAAKPVMQDAAARARIQAAKSAAAAAEPGTGAPKVHRWLREPPPAHPAPVPAADRPLQPRQELGSDPMQVRVVGGRETLS